MRNQSEEIIPCSVYVMCWEINSDDIIPCSLWNGETVHVRLQDTTEPSIDGNVWRDGAHGCVAFAA